MHVFYGRSKKHEKVVAPDENTAFLRGKLKCLQNKYNYNDFILVEG